VTDHADLPPGRAQEVEDGLYAFVQPDGTWWINNTGFLVGEAGVVAIDSCATVARTRAFQAAIAGVTDVPVRTLVNTHHHGDHTHGNFLFEPATIVAHERTRDEVIAEGPPATGRVAASGAWGPIDWGDVELAPPSLTFTDSLTVFVDDLPCRVEHVGTPAHTTNDSVVWIPERSVLYAGDLLFNGGTPFLLAGSIAGALEVVAGLHRYGARTVVPGHGPVAGPELIDRVLGYLRFVAGLAASARAAGLSQLDAARQADLGEFAELSDSERLVGNLHRAYAELDGAERGAPIDFFAALRDMIAYNGGKPLLTRV
jgi:cyclase